MNDIAASQSAMRAAAAAWSRARIYDDKLGDPDAARLAAWAESIERWELSIPDLCAAVNAFYENETTGRTIAIGDLLHHAREARRQRAEREKAAQSHTAAALNPGAAYEGLPINVTGEPVWAAYDVKAADTRPCPRCGAEPKHACVTKSGLPQKIPCLKRMNPQANEGIANA